MKPPQDMTQVINRVRYSTRSAVLLAGNDYWDGHNHERDGTNQFLYRSPRGLYFLAHLSQWQGSHDYIEPCSLDDAYAFYEIMQSMSPDCCLVEITKAFPSVRVEDA